MKAPDNNRSKILHLTSGCLFSSLVFSTERVYKAADQPPKHTKPAVLGWWNTYKAAKLQLRQDWGEHLAPLVAAFGRRVSAEHIHSDPIAPKNDDGKPEEETCAGGWEIHFSNCGSRRTLGYLPSAPDCCRAVPSYSMRRNAGSLRSGESPYSQHQHQPRHNKTKNIAKDGLRPFIAYVP